MAAKPASTPASAAVSQIGLSKESLSHLKCGTCEGFLSVPPITMDKGGNYACGRCNSSGTRVLIYEELAKYMVFPCKYEKCKIQVAWGQVDNHEKVCPQRTLICPFKSCKEIYALKTILQHFKATHKEYIYENETQIMRKMKNMPAKNFIDDRKFFLFLFNAVPYIVMVSLEHSTGEDPLVIKGYQFAFGVFSLDPSSKKFEYDVNLGITSSNGISKSYELKNKEIKPFDQRHHCLKCLSGSCSLPCHKNDKNKKWLNKIKIDNQGDMNATYTITIHDKSMPQAISNTEIPNVNTISKITCFCRELMSAPIYVCVSGHSLCMNCKRNMAYCPVCRQTISDTRNLVLEEIAETVKAPCQNADKGCKYSGSVKSTKQHLMDCKYNFV